MTNSEAYFDYLRRRSRLALFYRRHWLYPQLCSHLTGRVLDVGCGIGDMLRYRRNTVGVDVNPLTVAWCREQGLDAQLMEVNRLPFRDGEFEGVVLDNVLEHIEQPAPLLAEMRRVLVDGGTAIIGVPGRRGYAFDADHKVFYDEARLIATMRSAGFSPRRMMNMPVRSQWLDRQMRQYCLYGVFYRAPD